MEGAGYILTEIWRAKPPWLETSEAERKSYLDDIVNPILMRMLEKGAELLGCAVNDNTGAERIDYQFMAVWKFPSKELSERLEKEMKEVGFLNYFEQVNFSGSIIPPPFLNDAIVQI